MALLAGKFSLFAEKPARWALCLTLAAVAHVLPLSLVVLGTSSGGTSQPTTMQLQLGELNDTALAGRPVTAPLPRTVVLDSRAAQPLVLPGVLHRRQVPAAGAGQDWSAGRSGENSAAAAVLPVAALESLTAFADFNEPGDGQRPLLRAQPDAPLAAEVTFATGGRPGSGNRSGSAARASGGTGNGNLEGFADGGGGTDPLERALNRISPAKRAATLALEGQPNYPRACRQGLCRKGIPCEGESEWRITVAAAGGKALKVECLKAMGCELQNASIRKFFSEAKFPKTETPVVYIFPVPMKISTERE